ncbi:family 16 glycosylhydrolase [Streptomyces sp. So13.3]|uniref:cellulose binding domain-containing protein n=1 Tax=Streptomyces TaxID=1883 RepID=UPI001105F671|nr:MULTISPECIES: cellulose binding domain-containing protein [Streptomyces]MCZ4097212.1 family 16 glycosylhydrolase [Streptomyces sp. H39-C1]QNA78317.1 family 16 glycosylhydrolase [Streptomyces sp. So13.3]
MALCTSAGLACAALTAMPASAAQDSLSAQYRTSATGATADQSEPWLKVTNTGSTTVPLSGVTVRYYFKADTADSSYRFACSWAVRGCANITGTFGTLAHPTATADRYLEIGFTSGAGSLTPGADTSDMQLRFYRSTWATLRQSDDYSFNGAQTSYANWSKVTVQRGGTVLWGTAPDGNDPTQPPTDPPTTPPTTPPNQNGPALFDDFNYTSSSDPLVQQHGWTVKSGQGGPGVPGATWSPQDVTFAPENGNSIMNLKLTTDGTAAGTKETEIQTTARKFRNGTYAARVKFNDTPATGPDGDHVNQTFFAFTPLAHDMDPDYGELDFEYLPNGGWGETGNIMYTTSWETYQNDPWNAVNTHTESRQSYDGWHDLIVTVDNTNIKYYIDGQLFGTHGEPYLPETPMFIDFNHWLIDLAGQTGSTPRSYNQKVDYVYFAKDQVLSPAQVQAQVAAYRAAHVTQVDTVPAG